MVYSQKSVDTQALKNIQKGIAVRVKTQGNKIKFLNDQWSRLNNDAKKQVLYSRINQYKMEDESFYQDLQSAMKEAYTIGPYCFVMDTVFQEFLAGNTSLCTDGNTKNDQATIDSKDFYAIISERDEERLRFVDHQMAQPPAPLPFKAHVWYGFYISNRPKYLKLQIASFNKKIISLISKTL
jgi:hypothetical protein